MKTTSTRIFETQDGSHSIFSEIYGVSYHSKYGAIQESQHVFLEAGLFPVMARKKDVSVLEIGLGTGLNAFMTLLTAEKHKVKINYTGIEAHPISLEEVHQLNYTTCLEAEQWSDHFLKIHSSSEVDFHQLSPHFNFRKFQQKFEDLDYHNCFDIVYFDAFAPSSQPELWEVDIMQIMYKALKTDGILTTYCAKGAVKRTLKSIGFTVESIPGPPGKREMTRALKKE